MTTFDPRSEAWIGFDPDEIVRRVRCEADDAPDEGDSPAQIWRHACDTILLRMGKHPSQSPTPDGVIKEMGEDGRRPDGPGLSHSVSSPSVSPAAAASIPGAEAATDLEGMLHAAWHDERRDEPQNDPDAGLTHEQIAAEIGALARDGTAIGGTVLGALNRAYRRGLERRR